MGPVIEVTGNGVGTDGEQMRLHPVAGLERARASGVEVAPGWRLARAGDLAGQDVDPVRHVANDIEVVRDEEVGDPELVLQVSEQVEDLGLDGHVQGADRFVADDQLRVG